MPSPQNLKTSITITISLQFLPPCEGEKRERERENESCNWDLQTQQREERLLLLQGLAMVKSENMTQPINQYRLTGFDDEELLKHLRGLSGDQVGRYSS